jgi:hypothetical protein
MASGVRVALTRSQLSTDEGKRLVDLCLDLGLDGEFSDTDLVQLHKFLASVDNGSIPAVSHLKSLIFDAVADGAISESERSLIHKQIERVLPPSERERLALVRKEKEESRFRVQSFGVDWHDDPLSEAQIRYINSLGGDPSTVSTKGDAATLIDALLHSPKSITPRQRMVLQFWGATPSLDYGKPEISQWMDKWYSEDPDRLAAWESYKESVGDCGQMRDPSTIQFGIGGIWLQRVKNGKPAVIPSKQQTNSVFIIAFILAIVLLFAYMLYRTIMG